MTPQEMQEKANQDMKLKIAEHAAAVRKQAFEIQVQVEEGGKMPTKAHQEDAGFDVYATEDITLFPGQVKKTPLNIRLNLPVSTWAEITTKSGLGAKGQLVYAGVIDKGYAGIVHVIMTNQWIIDGLDDEGIPLMRTTPIVIKKGEKIAQLIMNPFCDQFYMVQVDKIDKDTARGEGGFGSTGKV